MDRIAAPYVEEIVGAVRTTNHAPEGDPGSAHGSPSERFHQLNHELRTIALEQAPKGSTRVVSIGASGRWYFDWFEASVGPVQEHIGVEAYLPEPDDLPDYVRWVAATADQLQDIEGASVDMVFAGQTSEHLWAGELVGFLCEAQRILREDGWLVLDSPNRSVTEHLHWSHGGHTIELSVSEIAELLELAGFDVVVTKGLWRCRFGDRILQLEDGLDDPALTLRRSLPCEPDDAFVWWVEAQRRPGATPAAAALAARVEELFARHWPTRVSRGMWAGPEPTDVPLDPGKALESLPFPLYQGQWTLRLGRVAPGSAQVDATIVAPGREVFADLRAEDAVADETAPMTWSFTMPFYVEALVLRVTSRSEAVRVALPADLVPAVRR